MPNTLFNVANLTSQHNIRTHERALTRANERLATGSRINQAKDDPFRNHESQNVNSEIRNVNKAKQNSSEGAALLQIADGTCNEVQNILQRIRELSVQSATDTLTSTERSYIDIESTELLKEIDRIAAGSIYNKKVIFGNSEDSFSGEQRSFEDWKPFTAKDALGNPTRAGVLHIGPNADKVDEVRISLPEISAWSLGIDTLSLTYQGGATRAMDDLDSAINSIGSIRSYMGSLVNRMENQIETLEETNVNLNDYTAKIRDTDFAKESTEFVGAQIRQQAAVSILAQSNARVNKILEMLT